MDPLTIAALVGGGAKTLGSLWNSYDQSQTEKENLRRQRDAINQASQLQTEGLDNILALYGGSDAIQKEYNDYLAKMKGFDPTTQMGQFDQSKYNVNAYLDPSMQYQLDQANRTLQSSLQGEGGLYSGKAMKALQNEAEKFAQTDYGNAFNRMTTDRTFGYQDFINRFNATKANKEAELEQLKNLFNVSSANQQMLGSSIGQKANIGSNKLLQNADIASKINSSNFNFRSGIVNTLGDAVGIGASAVAPMFAQVPTSGYVQNASGQLVPTSGTMSQYKLNGINDFYNANQNIDYGMGLQDLFDNANQGTLDAIHSSSKFGGL